MKKVLWVLKDDRPGNYNQAINLAKSLEFGYEIKEISYNFLAALPNFLKFGKLSTITQKSKNNLINKESGPDIVISAGRRSALVALDLKKIYPGLFLINIMNPGKSLLKKFDVVVAPTHDKLSGENIINILGSVTNVDGGEIKAKAEEFLPVFEGIKSPKIALLIGGSSKDAKFSLDDGKKIRKITDDICQNMKANLIVTTSRRTDAFLIKEIGDNNKNVKYFFEWGVGKSNPYLAILDAADFIIVTGDSIAMACEAVSFGKPTYIYSNSKICSKKHLSFQKLLVDGGYAFYLSDDLSELSNGVVRVLNEVDKIKVKILSQF